MFLNIAAYRFASLDNLKDLRERLQARCKALNLRGTILLSTEGINLFIAGLRPDMEALLAILRALPGMADLPVKESLSAEQPFRRMLVRIKKEIITFGVEGIDPAQKPSPKLLPRELKQWLDEGRPVTLLDTRNDYEVKLGTFRGAIVPGIDHFRQFPEAVKKLPPSLKDQPVVMFCTGGIRCEKAGPFMEREGFNHIYQLDGGILKYFEDCGGAHYDGECFVFDQRVGVDATLEESDTAQCFHCRASLTPEDMDSPRYQVAVSCPHCWQPPVEKMSEVIARRHEKLRQVTTPLPGSIPHENFRPVTVPTAFHGQTLRAFVTGCFPHIPADLWDKALNEGDILGPDQRETPAEPGRRVQRGEHYHHRQRASVEPDVNPGVRILFEDEAILVLHKPAPLPMHPGGRFSRNTLQSFLNAVYFSQRPRPAHRLDANTSGLVVVSRTRHAAGLLQPQFARREVEKRYLARVIGHPPEDHFRCEAAIRAAPGKLGSRGIEEATGQDALTDFTVLSRREEDGTALLEARPFTGRTNQIRLHLRHLGFPICGDQTYVADGELATAQTLPVGAPPLCLHAWKLKFAHPFTGEAMAFEAEIPAWAT